MRNTTVCNIFFVENWSDIRTNLIMPETIEFLPKICAANSMCLSLSVYTQLFFEARKVAASQTSAKTEFNARNSHSMSCILGSLESQEIKVHIVL